MFQHGKHGKSHTHAQEWTLQSANHLYQKPSAARNHEPARRMARALHSQPHKSIHHLLGNLSHIGSSAHCFTPCSDGQWVRGQPQAMPMVQKPASPTGYHQAQELTKPAAAECALMASSSCAPAGVAMMRSASSLRVGKV